MEPNWRAGSFVEVDGRLAVILEAEADKGVSEGHLALWFGKTGGTARSPGEGGPGKPFDQASSFAEA